MATVGRLNSKWMLDTSGFVGEAKKAAAEHARIVRQIARESKIPAIQFERDVRRSVTGPGSLDELKRERRAAIAEARQASFNRGVSGLADPSSPEFQMAGIKRMSSREAAGVTAEQSLAKQASQLEKVGKAMVGLRAGATFVRGLMAAWKGDTDGILEAVNQLPFGIGEVTAAAQELKAEWSGAKAEVERYREAAKQIEADASFRRNVADITRGAREEADQRRAEVEREIGGIGREGLDRELYQIQAQEQARVEAHQRAAEEAVKRAGVDTASKEAAKIREQFDRQIEDERRLAEAQRRDAIKEDAERRAQVAREQAEKEDQERQKAHEKELADAKRRDDEKKRAGEQMARAAEKQAQEQAARLEEARRPQFGTQIDAGLTMEGAAIAIRHNVAAAQAAAAAGPAQPVVDLQGIALQVLQQIAANTARQVLGRAGD